MTHLPTPPTSPFLSLPPSAWVASNELAFAILDRFPVNPGHTLVVPRRLVATYFEASADEKAALWALVDEVRAAVDQQLHPEGYNVGFNAGEAAGQTVPHLHIHVIPRFRGDVADPRGGVRHVIPARANYLLPDERRSPLATGGEHDPFGEHLWPLFASATEIAIVAAFVTETGLAILEERVFAALRNGASVRIVTGDYLAFNQVAALRQLLGWSQLRVRGEGDPGDALPCGQLGVRVVETALADGSERAFHPKSWLFQSSTLGVAFDQLQADLATQCATAFNRPVRPQISVETSEGKTVLVVFVPELAPAEKPLFLKSLGLPRGAFRRVGPTDQEGTDDDLIALYQGHQIDTYDGSALSDADRSDLDDEAIRVYRELRREANPVAEELTWTDLDLLRALGAVAVREEIVRPTVAGLLLFGTPLALRRCFPMMRIDYIRIPGREWISDPDRRFDTVEIRAPLLIAARRAIAAVRDDLPASFRLPEGATIRSDETVLPIRVLREAIVNAVMHRSYRIHGPIQILRYANRLEVRNPGHSLKAEEQLGEPGSQTRNPRVAAVLHEVHLAETKGSGIRAMRELMLQHDLLPPTFESSRRPDQFVATFLFHHFLGEADLKWLRSVTTERLSDEEARALVFVREAGAIDNAAYRAINRTDTLQASVHLRRLRDLQIMEMKGGGNRTYYVPNHWPDLKMEADPHQITGDPHQPGPDPHQVTADPHQVAGDPRQPGPAPRQAELEDSALPGDLAARVAEAGPRPRRDKIRELIRALCAWRPLSARALARFLSDRDQKELVRTHLTPMVETGELALTIPEMANHPDQKYKLPEPS